MSEKKIIDKLNIYIKQHRNDIYNRDLYNHVVKIKTKLKDYKKIRDRLDTDKKTKILTKIENEIPPLHRIVFYYRDGCNPCDKQKKIWNEVINNIRKKNSTIPIFEEKKTLTDGVKTYPCNKVYTPDGNVYLFNNESYTERNVYTLTSFFLKYI